MQREIFLYTDAVAFMTYSQARRREMKLKPLVKLWESWWSWGACSINTLHVCPMFPEDGYNYTLTKLNILTGIVGSTSSAYFFTSPTWDSQRVFCFSLFQRTLSMRCSMPWNHLFLTTHRGPGISGWGTLWGNVVSYSKLVFVTIQMVITINTTLSGNYWFL